jgi:Skp family chaperone for outer membrane proteins
MPGKLQSFAKRAGWLLLCWPTVLHAQTPEAEPPAEEATRIESVDWQFEQLILKDGREYLGLVQSIRDAEIEFAEIFRRPGRPMSAIVRVIDPRDVKKLQRLPPEERELMLDRFRQFKQRAKIEAGSMERISLTTASREGRKVKVYQGHWFSMTSTADEEATRRCIARIEQVFRAYRQLLPPRISGQQELRIVLYGSVDEYHTALRSKGLTLANLAFYSLRRNVIFAGAELSSYTRELQKIRKVHAAELRAADRDHDRFRQRLDTYSKKLSAKGFTSEQITDEMTLRNAAWKKEHAHLQNRIKETNRRNDAKFNEVTDRMFRRLYHEAFHAYLHSYVFPVGEYAVDRWLNEGLAQIFESGQLDADTLRIDAPPTKTLRALQRNLLGDNPLSLADLLTADDQDFLATHTNGASERHYLYAWGLAYYLTFRKGWLRSDQLESYLAKPKVPRIKRFEQLATMPLDQFEREWRQAILATQ